MTTMIRSLAVSAAALMGVALVPPTLAQAGPGAPGKPGSVQSYHMTMQSRGRLGARVISMSEGLRAYFGAPKDAGLLVDEVQPDTPAAAAGLQPGDVIVAVEGERIAEAWDIFQALSGAKKGDKVKVEILRDKKKRTLSATLDDEGAMNMQWGNMPGGSFDFDFGFDGDKLGPKAFGKVFPFGGNMDMRDRLRELEERLDRLEGKAGKKAPADKGKKLEGTSKGGKSRKL